MDSTPALPEDWADSYPDKQQLKSLGIAALIIIIVFAICMMLSKFWVQRKPVEPPPPITKLPIDIVLCVSDYLSPMDKLCFSLSCKSAWNALNGVQNSSKFGHPMKFSTSSFPHSRDHNLRSGYWQLLRRLEDSRFRCCAGCLKLHPVSEFSTRDLATVADQRTCMFGSLVGVIPLCPCIQLTFRTKLKLTAQLRKSAIANKTTDGLDTDAVFLSDWHECRYTQGSTKVHARHTPMLNQDGRLVITSHYTVDARRKLALVDFPGFCCPHRTISALVLASLDSSSKNDFSCKWCGTKIVNCSGPSGDNFVLETSRVLGKSEDVADQEWHLQTTGAFERFDILGPRRQWPGRSWDDIDDN
ncbi:uncharacterized protein CIMG_11763 [Coccidioides immitis RS]|uniref:F-box domain-containing protein n=4 Tax=Coccidioides immitis TaxID=5501 RepID=A0A0D8JTF7_COCIM|nr:uncharacterized protein CIMG_11763 [Coccidioides immitis RS]KMP03607.1 hypothetical protein CIRG_03299 [Coccidioides immitis RMSCC 2394]KMU73196.1 hypothetical protein CISG_03456 [Coccidioides immitis RMSCC 3703]KMU83099.1 hypothetical protein CIHG_00881 [Coccidioides immitis H538.4]TPX23872.1 hypothetical protein DIZ76_013215 [Coccidioides immitis]KJF60587.1 hypothetical protein CIMG_11763 [Coccidioides immitis RS]